jgi:hypothetical protein
MGLTYGMKLFRAAQECTGERMPDIWEYRGERHLLNHCDCEKRKRQMASIDAYVDENCDHSKNTAEHLVCKACAVAWAKIFSNR